MPFLTGFLTGVAEGVETQRKEKEARNRKINEMVMANDMAIGRLDHEWDKRADLEKTKLKLKREADLETARAEIDLYNQSRSKSADLPEGVVVDDADEIKFGDEIEVPTAEQEPIDDLSLAEMELAEAGDRAAFFAGSSSNRLRRMSETERQAAKDRYQIAKDRAGRETAILDKNSESPFNFIRDNITDTFQRQVQEKEPRLRDPITNQRIGWDNPRQLSKARRNRIATALFMEDIIEQAGELRDGKSTLLSNDQIFDVASTIVGDTVNTLDTMVRSGSTPELTERVQRLWSNLPEDVQKTLRTSEYSEVLGEMEALEPPQTVELPDAIAVRESARQQQQVEASPQVDPATKYTKTTVHNGIKYGKLPNGTWESFK